MTYTIEIDGMKLSGNCNNLIGTAINNLQEYFIPMLKCIVRKEPKEDLARQALSEYINLVIFYKKSCNEEIHPAISEIQSSITLYGDDILKKLSGSKLPEVLSILRQVRGETDISDVFNIFLDDLENVEEYE